MASLTSKLLDSYPYSRYADPRTIQRGHAYHKDERVWDITLSRHDTRAICRVDGDLGEYTVEIEVDQKSGELNFDCDCPYAEDHFCKHMVAAALELSEYLKEDGNEFAEDDEEIIPMFPARSSGNWQSKLNETLARVPRRLSSSNPLRYIALVVMTRSQYGYSSYGNPYWNAYFYALQPFIIKESEWDLIGGGLLKSPHEINDFLQTNKKWMKVAERQHQQVNPAGCMNLSSEAVSFLNFLSMLDNTYGVSGGMSMYLSMLAKLDIPIFLGSLYPDKIERRLHVLPDPVQIEIDIWSDETKLILQAGFRKDNTFIRVA